MRKERTASSVGILAAVAASLCCITPVIALVAGASGVAASISWLEPFRPYLIGVAILSLGFAWYQSLKAKEGMQCGLDSICTVQKQSSLASKTFLTLVTGATVLIIAFPYYAKVFCPKTQTQNLAVVDRGTIQAATFTIKGMTCAACEEHVNSQLSKVPGVIQAQTSYAKRNAVVRFDHTKTSVQQLQDAIAKTGYKVVATKLQTNGSVN